MAVDSIETLPPHPFVAPSRPQSGTKGCPLPLVERTWRRLPTTSAFDPNRTWLDTEPNRAADLPCLLEEAARLIAAEPLDAGLCGQFRTVVDAGDVTAPRWVESRAARTSMMPRAVLHPIFRTPMSCGTLAGVMMGLASRVMVKSPGRAAGQSRPSMGASCARHVAEILSRS